MSQRSRVVGSWAGPEIWNCSVPARVVSLRRMDQSTPFCVRGWSITRPCATTAPSGRTARKRPDQNPGGVKRRLTRTDAVPATRPEAFAEPQRMRSSTAAASPLRTCHLAERPGTSAAMATSERRLSSFLLLESRLRAATSASHTCPWRLTTLKNQGFRDRSTHLGERPLT
jgi:hypothetical protein